MLNNSTNKGLVSASAWGGPWPFESIVSFGTKYCLANHISVAQFSRLMRDFKSGTGTGGRCILSADFDFRGLGRLVGVTDARMKSMSLQTNDVLREAMRTLDRSCEPNFSDLTVCRKCFARGYHSAFHQWPCLEHCFVHHEQALTPLARRSERWAALGDGVYGWMNQFIEHYRDLGCRYPTRSETGTIARHAQALVDSVRVLAEQVTTTKTTIFKGAGKSTGRLLRAFFYGASKDSRIASITHENVREQFEGIAYPEGVDFETLLAIRVWQAAYDIRAPDWRQQLSREYSRRRWRHRSCLRAAAALRGRYMIHSPYGWQGKLDAAHPLRMIATRGQKGAICSHCLAVEALYDLLEPRNTSGIVCMGDVSWAASWGLAKPAKPRAAPQQRQLMRRPVAPVCGRPILSSRQEEHLRQLIAPLAAPLALFLDKLLDIWVKNYILRLREFSCEREHMIHAPSDFETDELQFSMRTRNTIMLTWSGQDLVMRFLEVDSDRRGVVEVEGAPDCQGMAWLSPKSLGTRYRLD